MAILLTLIHVLICILLVLVVLLQSGKGGGLASSIAGGLSSASFLGGRTASNFLTKATTVLATAFFLSCLVQFLTFDSGRDEASSATERLLQPQQAASPVPFTPAPAAGGGEVLPAAPAPASPAGQSGP
ncbi:MAG: preprotein translocase subunit SecG [Candidatus Latescibacteria bacterium]|nr:preprotein translocase subunit SecG [Candidatus Latescibacterota bacterium]